MHRSPKDPETTRVEAVLLDCLGTLVRLRPPAPRLRAELRERIGVDVGESAAAAAFRAEIDYYLAHHLEGRDAAALDDLRDRCAEVIATSLELENRPLAMVREAMLASLRFVAHADAPPALRALRAAGLRLVVASNWDCALPEVLERAGIEPLVDRVVSSAEVGAAKPDPALPLAALAAADCEPAHAIFVGDSIERDVAGARAAGIRPVLMVRGGERARRAFAASVTPKETPDQANAPSIGTLADLRSLI